MAETLNNGFALLGIALALCAALLYFFGSSNGARGWAKWLALACFSALWWPLGAAQLPVVAYVRGISSDLSITLVGMSVFRLLQELPGMPQISQREKRVVLALAAASALFLYPMALGLGDWDPYRLGWGSPGMLLALLLVAMAGWVAGLRLLPLLIALCLLAWTVGLLESTNLWDYLIDPWLVAVALAVGLRTLALKVASRLKTMRGTIAPPAST